MSSKFFTILSLSILVIIFVIIPIIITYHKKTLKSNGIYQIPTFDYIDFETFDTNTYSFPLQKAIRIEFSDFVLMPYSREFLMTSSEITMLNQVEKFKRNSIDLIAVQGAIYEEDNLVYLKSEIAPGDVFEINYILPVNNITIKAVYPDLVYESLDYTDQDYPVTISNAVGYTVFDFIMIGGGGGGGASRAIEIDESSNSIGYGGGGGGGGAYIMGRQELNVNKIQNITIELSSTKGFGGTSAEDNGKNGDSITLFHSYSNQYNLNVSASGGDGGKSLNDGSIGGPGGLGVFFNPIQNSGQIFKSNGGAGKNGLNPTALGLTGGGDGGNSGMRAVYNVDPVGNGANGSSTSQSDGKGTTIDGLRNQNGKLYGGGGAGRHANTENTSPAILSGNDGGNSYWKVVLKKLNITPQVFNFVYDAFTEGTAIGYGTTTFERTTKITITFQSPNENEGNANLIISSSEITNINDILSFTKDGVEKVRNPNHVYYDSPSGDSNPVAYYSNVEQAFVFNLVFAKEITSITIIS